jgi:hypothetical protein
MHASHFDPRLLTAGFAALVVALLLALVPSLPPIHLGTSGGSAAAPATTAPAAQTGTTSEPRWVIAPLRAPAP